LNELPAAERTALVAKLEANPPYFFEHPDLDPESDIVGKYLADLAALQVRVSPRDSRLDEIVTDVAEYLRYDPRSVQRTLEKEYATHLAERLSPESPVRKAPTDVARAVLDLLEPGEMGRFLYTGVTLERPAGTDGGALPSGNLWLLGAGNRLILFSVADEIPVLLWRGEGPLEFRQEKGFLSNAARLRGGKWLQEFGDAQPVIRLTAPMVKSIGNYFGPLQTICAALGKISEQSQSPQVVQN
jgi:hypothetical protein